MKVAPVSGDLLVKLGLGVAVVGAAWWAVNKAKTAFAGVPSQWWNTATEGVTTLAQSVNPLNNENVIYRGANVLTGGGGAVADVPLGTRIYNALNPDEFTSWTAPAVVDSVNDPDWSTAGGRFNNPSAYQAPGVTGAGGAAFGIYPRA